MEDKEYRIIYEVVSGSHLYKMNTENSDRDYLGIIVPIDDYLYGLKNVKELDLSSKDKDENGKNTKNAIDRKFFDFRHFIRECYVGTPNTIELLFAGEENIITKEPIMDTILENKHLFISLNLITKLSGYSRAMERKLSNNSSNIHLLKEALDYLNLADDKIPMASLENDEKFKTIFKLNNEKDQHYRVGVYAVNRYVSTKRARIQIGEIYNNSTHRKDVILKSGYDCKAAYHWIRLMIQAIYVLKNGYIKYPFEQKDHDLVMSVKNGILSYEQVIKVGHEISDIMNSLADENPLNIPKEANFNKINMLYKHIMLEEISKYVTKE